MSTVYDDSMTRADLGVGSGALVPSFVREFFTFVNVCRMVLRALLLKNIFFNEHC